MDDPHFRLYVGVYEINKIIHECLEIRNLSSRVQFDLLSDFFKFYLFLIECQSLLPQFAPFITFSNGRTVL